MPQGKEYCSIKRMQFAALCANYIISFVSQNNKKKIIPLKKRQEQAINKSVYIELDNFFCA